MHNEFAFHLLWLAGALCASVILGSFAIRLKQPRVLGGLIGGLLISIAFTHTNVMHELRSEQSIPFIKGLAEFAAMLLLFRAGLEGNIHSILHDAKTGWKVAAIGVIMPMIGGYIYTYYVVDVPWQVALFQGGVFAATSVGITAAVLGELGVLNKSYAKTIISAAVIDDVLGLMVLTVCGALNTDDMANAYAIAQNIAGAILFVIIVPVIGHYLAPRILRTLGRFDVQAREAIVLSFLFFYGAGAMLAGLAAIVGSYFAGVALDEVFFEARARDPHQPVEHFIDSLITALGPVFFVYAGCVVNPTVFLNTAVLGYGLMFTCIAVAGKLACGLVVRNDRLIVGMGMIPRGEVGIIFASIGLQSGALTTELFGASMIMVLLTTIITPIGLNMLTAHATQEAVPDRITVN